ncbi:MAG: membrane protein insertase YidC [Thiotrichales bacterium]|nr:membrane protein insertase YidC [Thiotrichales bacterium]
MMLIQAWEEDYGIQQTDPPAQADAAPEPAPELADVPEIPVPAEPLQAARVPRETTAAASADHIRVVTDTYRLRINPVGGGIDHLELLKYPVAIDRPDEPEVILAKRNNWFYILQGGLLSDQAAPAHDAMYVSDRDEYVLSDRADTPVVPLRWQSDDGLTVVKTYRFSRDSYEIELEYQLQNSGAGPWSGRAYGQLQRNDPNRGGARLIYTYTGAILSSPEERYKKISFEDMEDKALGRNITDGWAAMLQHYFVSALIPGAGDVPHYYYSKALPEEDRYLIGMMSPTIQLAAGSSTQFSHKLFIGPKTQRLLEKAAPRLELTVDYGSLWFVANPLFICLDWFHGLTGNWGFAIILVTLLIKILFYPLSAAGYRSMANMRKVQPRLLAIRDRYKDDKARLNQAMMDLYKKEKINPLGGCFPILIQIPVFIALYWVLLESVELRQAPFILWIQNLSSPDPWYVLPVLMGISMYIQQKLNPAPMDPVQEKVMMTLPFVFTIFFAFFPSGLVLYWVINNILSIAQQWMITRQIEAGGKD